MLSQIDLIRLSLREATEFLVLFSLAYQDHTNKLSPQVYLALVSKNVDSNSFHNNPLARESTVKTVRVVQSKG